MHFNPAGLPLLRAYTDETGDRGFTAKASPIFGITAVLVPDEHDAAVQAVVERLRSDFGIVDAPLRWAKHCGPTRHDRRRHVARLLAALPGVQVIYVVIDKSCVPADAGMRDDNSLAFNFTAKLLFERIALSARDWPGGRRRAIVRVSHVKGHDHPEMLRYIREQCPRQTGSGWIPWSLATSAVTIDSPAQILGLQAADLYAGIFWAALTPDKYKVTDHGHLLEVAHQIRRVDGKMLGYGIKVLGDRNQLITGQSWWPAVGGSIAA